MERNSWRDSPELDIKSATSQLVALTKAGAVDPEVSLVILVQLRAQLLHLRELLQSHLTTREGPGEREITYDAPS